MHSPRFPRDPLPAHADRLAEAQAILDGQSRQPPNVQHLAALAQELDDLAAHVERIVTRRLHRVAA